MPFRRKLASRLLLLSAVVWLWTRAATAEPSLESLNPKARQVFLATMDWGDRCWDPQANLIAYSPHGQDQVRESSVYALGLLLRNGQSDKSRAIDILNAVLAQQYNAPGLPYDGTFHRNLSEPNPPVNAVIWRDYDPNWREFIGTTFAMILKEYPKSLPRELVQRMEQSIVLSVQGEINNHRLVPTYTNPALMYGFLWSYAAALSHRADWLGESASWQETVYTLFKKFDAFNEYNSPTYCGVDLYALSLWRSYGSTPRTRDMGREMEAALWSDEARFYNANLRNLSGPFDRAYGMDMESYVSVIGLALRTQLDAHTAPFPKLTPPLDQLDHAGDLWFAPQFAILGVRIPRDAMRSFSRFQGEKLVRRQITEQRVATAWIGRDVMYGGESTSMTKDIGEEGQFHPATIQWRTPGGRNGWVAMTRSPPLDVRADRSGLTISCSGELRFMLHADGILSTNVKQTEWVLPGIVVRIKSDAKQFALIPKAHGVEVEYVGTTRMNLRIQPIP